MRATSGLFDELVVDHFAGGGGASIGIERALGRPVDVAINHDREAIAMHQENHPNTRHYCEDIWKVDPLVATRGRPVGLLWASPDCKHFSRAKGQKPREKKIRGLAWVVIRWAKAVKPRVIFLENVEEFETWGPVLPDGTPCPARSGVTFKRWTAALRKLGYRLEHRSLVAADYGAPTTRKRLYLIARCDDEPIFWPDPTHGLGRAAPWRTAGEIIQWGLPARSIFDRARPLVENTMRRIANGMRRYVIEARQPFIVRTGHYSNLTGEGNGFRGQGLRTPLGTVCATNDKNLVIPWIAKHYTGVTGHNLERPLGCVTAKDHHSLASAFLETDQARRPEFAAFLTKYYGTGVGQDLFGPLHTVTANHRFGLVEVSGVQREITDVGMRMLAPRELYRAQGFPDDVEFEHVDGIRLTQAAQIRLCGNSVCPSVAEALVHSNVSIGAMRGAA